MIARRLARPNVMRWTGGALCGAALRVAAALAAAGTARAEDGAALLRLADARDGVCLHLGCGRSDSAGLTAELAAAGRMIVHGLALDDAACERARAPIRARAVQGVARVECLPLAPLPFVSDLATLIVIEDPAGLARGGLASAEVQRVLAPGGVLLERRGETWTRSVKPWPAGADDWTHPLHGPDGNRVSRTHVAPPLGLRWQDGLPLNLVHWASVRSYIAANGRVFSIGMTEPENLLTDPFTRAAKQQWLTARDAASGLPLWKTALENTDERSDLNTLNTLPFATDGRRVIAPRGRGLVAFDAATGATLREFPVECPPARLALLDGVLVAAGWNAVKPVEIWSPDAPTNTFARLWDVRTAADAAGRIEVFDAAGGQRLWQDTVSAQALFADAGRVVYLVQNPAPVNEQWIVARDLKTGAECWRTPHTALGDKADLILLGLGRGLVVLGHLKTGSKGWGVSCQGAVALSAADGKRAWEAEGNSGPSCLITSDAVWYGSKRLDPATGNVLGPAPFNVMSAMCAPPALIGDIGGTGRGASWSLAGVSTNPAAAGAGLRPGVRGSCVQGAAASDDRIYIAQNYCRCAPAHLPGFMALGTQQAPSSNQFAAARPVQGAAAAPAPAGAGAEWPTLRYDGARSACTPAALPTNLVQRWVAAAATPPAHPLAQVWRDALKPTLSAPVAGNGLVLVSSCDAGDVVALARKDGEVRWRATTGGRLDSPPTLHGGLCLAGSHDGWLYAFDAADGRLRWRTRIAPAERRMAAFGQLESSWPVIGSPLVATGVVYCVAGRSTEMDGGCALVACDPASGATRWAAQVALSPGRRSDMPMWSDGAVGLQSWRFDPASGRLLTPVNPKEPRPRGNLDGLIDGSWTRVGSRRSGGYMVGELQADVLAWDGEFVVGFSSNPNHYGGYAITRAAAAAADPKKPREAATTWRWDCTRQRQVEALVIGSNAVLAAGRVWNADPTKVTGFLVVLNRADGKPLADLPLPAPAVHHGLCAAGEWIFAAMEDGRVAAFSGG